VIQDPISALLLSISDVQKLLGVSRSKFEEIRQIQGFPLPIRPTKSAMYFKIEIEQWLKDLPRAQR
jgi:predicted DNA-binding transcriptional regulator AlpA